MAVKKGTGRLIQEEASEAAQSYVRALADKAKQARFPELLHDRHPRSLYQHIDRHGVSAIVIAQRDLSDRQLQDILRFRLANALLYEHVFPDPVYERRAEQEWWFTGSPEDILLIAGSSETGEIGSHAALTFLPGATPEMTLRTSERPLYEVEEVFGWQAFHRLPVLPDIPLPGVFESRRFVKTYWLDPLGDLAFRASFELGVASFHATTGPLAHAIQAVIGEIVPIARRNLDFFATPYVTLGNASKITGDEPPHPRPIATVQSAPYAMLTCEVPASRPRVAAVEAALELPGRQSLQALMTLGADAQYHPSSILTPQ